MADFEVINPTSPDILNFGLSIPKPFVLAEQDKGDLDKILSEVMDKQSTWDRRIAPFVSAYERGADSWRVKPTKTRSGTKQLFNSKSGETHRAAETLATLWHRMIWGQEPSFEAVRQGLNAFGQEITDDEIYATEGVLLEQQKANRLKDKQLNCFRSLALMGTLCVELPFTSRPFGSERKNIEFTDWQFRPMTRVGFDTSVYDLRDSDYIFTIDFLTKWMLRNMASLDTEFWDMSVVEKHIEEFKSGNFSNSRLANSKARAGYFDSDAGIYEAISYHGRLEPENSVIQRFAESIQLDRDPKFVDWSTSILDGMEIGQFHMTQYGDWRTRFVSGTYKKFEDEPLGYGIAQTGRRLQRDMDINESMTNDLMAAFTHMMWKAGKYGGLQEKQMAFEPLKVFEMDDITQLAPLMPDPAAFRVALEMLNLRREDFRNIVGAQTNLQAQLTKASATESAIAQTEAIRGAGVHAELIAEMYREYLEIAHVNNLNYLDEPIWVGLTGSQKPLLVDKNMLPVNVGFKVKIVTDKDFRPERLQRLLEALNLTTTVRGFVPPQLALNAINELYKEIWKTLGMNPRILNQEVPLIQQMQMQMARLPNGGAELGAEQSAEQQGDATGGGENIQNTPVGPVPTSPVGTPDGFAVSA